MIVVAEAEKKKDMNLIKEANAFKCSSDEKVEEDITEENLKKHFD